MSQSANHDPNDSGGLTIQDLINLPEDTRLLLTWMQRQAACTLQTISLFLNQTEEQTNSLLEELQTQGLVQTTLAGQETLYQVHLKSMRRQLYRPDLDNLLEMFIHTDEHSS